MDDTQAFIKFFLFFKSVVRNENEVLKCDIIEISREV